MVFPNPAVVDLSHYNLGFDFAVLARAGIAGVINKASQGGDFHDDTYGARRAKAKANGLLWGAYHFLDGSDVDRQLANFLTIAEPDNETLLAVDFEKNTTAGATTATLDQLDEFLRKLLSARAGCRPVIYCGGYFKGEVRQADHRFGGYRLWLSQFSREPQVPRSWTSCWLWQFTDGRTTRGPYVEARLPGLAHPLDLDHFAGTLDDLKRQWA